MMGEKDYRHNFLLFFLLKIIFDKKKGIIVLLKSTNTSLSSISLLFLLNQTILQIYSISHIFLSSYTLSHLIFPSHFLSTSKHTIEVGQKPGNTKAIGFNYTFLNKQQQPATARKFVPTINEHDPTMTRHMLQHPVQPKKTKANKKRSWVCHHCGMSGHIRPYCYRLNGFPQAYDQPKVSNKTAQGMKEWKSKEESPTQIAKATHITNVPATATKKNETKTSTVKKGTYMPGSDSASATSDIHFGTDGNSDSPFVVKKPHTLTSLYLDPVYPKTVEPNANTYQKGFIVSNVEISSEFSTGPLILLCCSLVCQN
jgi:hypothetical protein